MVGNKRYLTGTMAGGDVKTIGLQPRADPIHERQGLNSYAYH